MVDLPWVQSVKNHEKNKHLDWLVVGCFVFVVLLDSSKATGKHQKTAWLKQGVVANRYHHVIP